MWSGVGISSEMFRYNPGSLFSSMLTGGDLARADNSPAHGTVRHYRVPVGLMSQCDSGSRVWTVCGVRPGEQNTASARREGEGAEQQALVAQNGSVG